MLVSTASSSEQVVDSKRKPLLVFVTLVLLTVILAGVCVFKFYKVVHLFPAEKSQYPWHLGSNADVSSGGDSFLSVVSLENELRFKYLVGSDKENAFARIFLAFSSGDRSSPYSDLSAYRSLSFRVKCSQKNTMAFTLRTFDNKVTELGNSITYRFASHPFDCSAAWTSVDVDLAHMEVPLWWLSRYGLDVFDQSYDLSKSLAFTFDSSRLGPINTPINVQINELELKGYDWRYLVLFVVLAILIWMFFVLWFLKQRSLHLVGEIQQKFERERPLTALQFHTPETSENPELRTILEYIAKEYSNPDLNLELLVEELGMNRKRINELLKDGLGITYRSYLNKIRLTEAARLVSERTDLRVKEIGHSVGFNSVTHFFNKFKEEFGCSPNQFRENQSSFSDNQR